VLEEVRALSARYFGAEDKDTAARWQDTWQHPYRLPRLVSVASRLFNPTGDNGQR